MPDLLDISLKFTKQSFICDEFIVSHAIALLVRQLITLQLDISFRAIESAESQLIISQLMAFSANQCAVQKIISQLSTSFASPQFVVHSRNLHLFFADSENPRLIMRSLVN